MQPTLTRRGLLMASTAAVAGLVLFPGADRLRAGESGAQRYHALLVAVTEYPNLPPNNALTGPNNDARLVREYLLGSAPVPFHPDDITVLADNLDDAVAPPTLAEIRKAMAGLADRAGDGDFVYLHFSGHGHQQPARDPENEIDGLDEVFMPRDVQMMTRASRHWPNGYVDKDIKADLDRIRATGAFIWAVFDCCHSATMTRNVQQADAGEVERKVDLAGMDIPEDLWQGTRRGVSGTPRQTMLSEGTAGDVSAAGGGGLVAFFASQTIEPTFEMLLPRDAQEQTQMGLFTFSVLQQLGRNPAITYRQLGEAVLQSYTAMGRRAPIPMFEGEIDTAVFAAGDLQYVPQWQVRDGAQGREIAAGHLHQLGIGTRLAVLAGPADSLDEAIGLVEIASAGPMRSTLGPVRVSEGDAPPAIPPVLPDDIPDFAYVRMIEQVIAMELTVALPSGGVDRAAEATAVVETLQRLADDPLAPFRLRLVAPDASADLRFDVFARADILRMMEQQEGPLAVDATLRATAGSSIEPELWMLDASAAVSLRPGFVPPSRNLARIGEAELEAWLRDSLTRVYRATNLARMAANDGFGADDVRVELYLKRTAPDGSISEAPLRNPDIPFARPGDEVHLRVENNSNRAVDVHALFVGADYAIVPAAHPERLHPGNRLDRGLFGISDSTFGRERVVVALSDETDGMGPRLDLSYLAQPGVRSATLTRGFPTGLRGLIEDLSNASAPTTRSGVALGAGPAQAREALLVYSLDVVPAG